MEITSEMVLEWSGFRTYALMVATILLIIFVLRRKTKGKKILTSFTFWFLTALIVLNGYSEYKLIETQIAGSEIAIEVSQNSKSHLKCQRFSEAFFDAQTTKKGFVYYSRPNTAIVKYKECSTLASLLNNPQKETTEEDAFAFAILIHEAVHTSGEYSESLTECVTHKLFVPAAVKAGIPEQTAEQLISVYITNFHQHMKAEYRYTEGDCDEHRLLPQPE